MHGTSAPRALGACAHLHPLPSVPSSPPPLSSSLVSCSLPPSFSPPHSRQNRNQRTSTRAAEKPQNQQPQRRTKKRARAQGHARALKADLPYVLSSSVVRLLACVCARSRPQGRRTRAGF